MNDLYLGLDCGTQGTKALIVDNTGLALGRGHATHLLVEKDSGAREQEPAWWVSAMRTAMGQALATIDPGKVRAIGVSGQQHGLVILDETKTVIRSCKLWNDTETAAQNDALIARFGGRKAFFERFGIAPLTGYTASKLLWLFETEPDHFARIRHILLPHDYLNFWLTGQIRAEFGDASGTAFFDVRSRMWIREILDEIDGGTGHLVRALPPLIQAEEIVGIIRPEVAAEFGLRQDCVVSSGGGDNMMGAIGTGNVREGIVTLSLGTSSTVYSFRNSHSTDPTGCMAPFCSSSGGWLPLVCTMNATNVINQTMAVFEKKVEDLEDCLASTEPGANGLTFLPLLNGERTPDLPKARGSLLGISPSNFTPENVIRAAVEGVSYGVLAGLQVVLDGEAPKTIRLIGGGARSAGWRQLLADASGATIEVPVEAEAGCLGAAMQAIYAESHLLGVPESLERIASRCMRLDSSKVALPDKTKRKLYQGAITRYEESLGLLYGIDRSR